MPLFFSIRLQCAGCQAIFTPGSSTLSNEYCLECTYRLKLFTPLHTPRPRIGKPCAFCSAPIPSGQKRFCDYLCKQRFWDGVDPRTVVTQVCLVCGVEYNGPMRRVTCSGLCAAMLRSETPQEGCKRCGGGKPSPRHLLCSSCAETQRRRFRER